MRTDLPLPTISFIVPVRNDAVRLRRCLASIRSDGSEATSEIIVADNGSTDDSASVAREMGAAVLNLPDRAVAQMRNDAARTAKGALLAFVDADHELVRGWTDTAVGLIASPATWAVGADYVAPDPGTWVQRMYDNLRSRSPVPARVEWLPSGNLVVRREAFDRVGGFDTRLESCEDVDLCRRLREAGGVLVGANALRSVHHGDPRSLRALFFAELWRGRDNLRVTLMERLTLRSAVGIAITIVYLLALATAGIGLFAWPVAGPNAVIAGASVMALLTALRAGRLLSRIPRAIRRLRDVPEAILVAGAYDMARALALVARVGHDVRRRNGR